MAAGWKIGGGERVVIIFPIKNYDSNRSQGEARLGHHSVRAAVNRLYFSLFILIFCWLLVLVRSERVKKRQKRRSYRPLRLVGARVRHPLHEWGV